MKDFKKEKLEKLSLHGELHREHVFWINLFSAFLVHFFLNLFIHSIQVYVSVFKNEKTYPGTGK